MIRIAAFLVAIFVKTKTVLYFVFEYRKQFFQLLLSNVRLVVYFFIDSLVLENLMVFSFLQIFSELIKRVEHELIQRFSEQYLFFNQLFSGEANLLQNKYNQISLILSQRRENSLVIINLFIFLVHVVKKIEISQLVVVGISSVDWVVQKRELIEHFSGDH